MSHHVGDLLDVQIRRLGPPHIQVDVCDDNDRQTANLITEQPQSPHLKVPTYFPRRKLIHLQNEATSFCINMGPAHPAQTPTPPGDTLPGMEETCSSPVNPKPGHPASSSTVTQTSNVVSYVPKSLPFWKWQDDSCSLDATLL